MVRIRRRIALMASSSSATSYPVFESVRAAAGDAIDLAGFAFIREMSVVCGDAPALAAGGMLVSENCFWTLRPPGRPLTEGNSDPGVRSAVLSHSYWQRAFGGDPGVVGREMMLNGRPFQIVGVTEKCARRLKAPIRTRAHTPPAPAPAAPTPPKGARWCHAPHSTGRLG